MGLSKSKGGTNSRAKMMGKEVISHSPAGYPKGRQGKAPSAATQDGPDAMAHSDLGGPVRKVSDYHEHT